MAGPRNRNPVVAPQPSGRARGRGNPSNEPEMVIGQANSGGTGGMQPIAVRTDAYGNSVPDPSVDPEGYRQWHAANLAAQRGDNSDPARQNELLSADIQPDLDRRQCASTGLQDTFNSIKADGGPLASNGTTTRPSLRENLDRAAASGAFQGMTPDFDVSGLGSSFQLSPESRNSLNQRTAGMFDNFDMSGLDGGVVENPSDAEVAAGNAADAIGGAPRVDMGLADRRLGEYQESLGMSREVIDRLLNGPSTAERLGSQTLRTQLALARSARGGPGAVQQALSQAQQQAPELQATATEQARQEELSKLTAAGNVASNFAQAALGARGQDVNIASKNVDSGLQVKDMIARLTGTQLELDQRNTELLGQMARDLAALDFDWATLSAQQASAALDRYMQIYGIDQNYAAQIKALEQSGKITGKDIFNGIIGLTGGAATLGAAALGKPPI